MLGCVDLRKVFKAFAKGPALDYDLDNLWLYDLVFGLVVKYVRDTLYYHRENSHAMQRTRYPQSDALCPG
jgi:hypothetical protein